MERGAYRIRRADRCPVDSESAVGGGVHCAGTRGLSVLNRPVSEGRSPETASFERSELLPPV